MFTRRTPSHASSVSLFEPASSARNDERGFRKSTSSCKFFSMVEVQGANGRFQVWDCGGAVTEMGAQLSFIDRVTCCELPVDHRPVGFGMPAMPLLGAGVLVKSRFELLVGEASAWAIRIAASKTPVTTGNSRSRGLAERRRLRSPVKPQMHFKTKCSGRDPSAPPGSCPAPPKPAGAAVSKPRVSRDRNQTRGYRARRRRTD